MSDTIEQAITHYPEGTFSWAELATTNTQAAKQFYTELFGWGYEDSPIGDGTFYTMFRLGGKDVAALYALAPEQLEQGFPPSWNSYISVNNVDESSARVQAAGGTVIAPPFDVMEQGRMSVILDAGGALVSLWEARSHIGASALNFDHQSNVPGAMTWNELYTHNVAAAASFYSTLLGWAVEVGEHEGKPFASATNKGRPVAVMMTMREELASVVPPSWVIYFDVADLDASVATVRALGGIIVEGPAESMGYRYAAVRDPQGALFHMIG